MLKVHDGITLNFLTKEREGITSTWIFPDYLMTSIEEIARWKQLRKNNLKQLRIGPDL